MNQTRRLLTDLFDIATARAHPAQCLPAHLPPPPAGRLIVLAGGKAAGAMAETAEAFYRPQMPAERIIGLAVARHGYGRPTRLIRMIEAGHPVPDAASLAAAGDILALAESAGPDDLVLGEMNCVRKHLSRIKGGRLARAAAPARVVTLAISDVPGDDPAVIGSGPTVPDPTTLADARAIVERYRLDLPENVRRALNDPANESPKPGDPAFANTTFTLVATPAASFSAAQDAVRDAGYACVFLGDQVEGEAREIASQHAAMARDLQRQGKRAIILSGGELTVTLRGKGGRGGPNQEYALALAQALDGSRGIAALAGDTDGTDGGGGSADDPAGAYADGTTAARARAAGLDPAVFLADNNSTEFFSRLGDLLETGPTFTNVNDFRALIVDTP